MTPEELDQLISFLPFSAGDRQLLSETVRRANPTHGLRATFTLTLDALMKERVADASRYEAFVQRFPKVAPFEFRPLVQLVPILAKAGALLNPGQPLPESSNSAFAAYVQCLDAHTNSRQMMVAAGNNLFNYLELVSESSHLWYNFGERKAFRESPKTMRLEFEGYSTELARYWVPGLNTGLLKLFEVAGRVELAPDDSEHFCLRVCLD